tara:strand:+ start:53447 stop:54169 length:723 start_codon:yes stop_codon:yes gene_type:complete
MAKISKHQQQGKHSLNYDIIFKGRKEEISEDDYNTSTFDYQDTFQYDPGTPLYDEAYNNTDVERKRKITKKTYDIIREKTDINLETSRRKPSKVAFNKYFILLKKELRDESFTNVELFNELAVYFSDNLMSIFKLLDNQWRNLIIKELQDHIGKATDESKVVSIKNLKIGAEIEFEYFDDIEDLYKLITGVVLEYDKLDEVFKIDSFENIYFVEITSIIRIMNNTKFKYNLNKLNNIDFL